MFNSREYHITKNGMFFVVAGMRGFLDTYTVVEDNHRALWDSKKEAREAAKRDAIRNNVKPIIIVNC